MELCCPPRAIPTLSHRRPFSNPLTFSPLRRRRTTPFLLSAKSLASRLRRDALRPRAAASEETSAVVVSNKFERSPDETTKTTEEFSYESGEPPVGSDGGEVMDFLSKLDLKLDSEDTYTILLYGAGAVFALWISSAIVGALDSVPLLPKVMEVVGLSFTVWFSYRYLIFKENRDELFAKIEDLKKQIIGFDD